MICNPDLDRAHRCERCDRAWSDACRRLIDAVPERNQRITEEKAA